MTSALFPEAEQNLNSNSNRGSLFQRRGENRLSSIVEECKANCIDINKVIIPYNFEIKQYAIDQNQIEFLEDKKDFVLKTISRYNSENAFKIGDKYQATCLEKCFVNFLLFIIGIVFLYVILIFLIFLSFNPMIIFCCFLFGRKICRFLGTMKLLIYERYKLSEINKILETQNSSNFYRENKLKWVLGQNGYWLELQKEI